MGTASTAHNQRVLVNTKATIAKARKIIKLYEKAGIKRERILIKIATTWEGTRAAEVLQKESTSCNMTLLFSFAQAVIDPAAVDNERGWVSSEAAKRAAVDDALAEPSMLVRAAVEESEDLAFGGAEDCDVVAALDLHRTAAAHGDLVDPADVEPFGGVHASSSCGIKRAIGA